jgi:hypothetical protein
MGPGLYEVYVNGVFDGAQLDTDRWITYGTQTSNTYSVRALCWRAVTALLVAGATLRSR